MISILFIILALLTAITIHEFAHAWVADKLGDPTARLAGRVSLNPMMHLDPYGSLIFLFLLLANSPIIIGWGKPVPFDSFNLDNPRKDSMLISLAGPLSNIILATFASFLARLLLLTSYNLTVSFLLLFLEFLIRYNVILAVFNLLPIHPLDGFKVVGGLLSEEKAREWYQLAGYGIFFLVTLLLPLPGGSILGNILGPPISFLLSLLLP